MIKNFCIIAHIDHGKSTLADRMLDVTKTLDHGDKGKDQVLDLMDIERERGITIKLTPVRMSWKGVQMNLIDTPGHVDFTYEVSRSLEACEGAILVVDATQGIEAQTLANVYMAMEADLKIIPVVNKIDLPAAEPEKRAMEIETTLGIPAEEVLFCSAKEGKGVPEILDAVMERVPAAKEVDSDAPKALIFDSFYDNYLGVVTYVRMMEGTIKTGDKLHMMRSGADGEVMEIGTFSPGRVKGSVLNPGEVGYIATSQKNVKDARVGDTITKLAKSYSEPLPGYSEPESMVFAGVFCSDNGDYPQLRDALEKLSLNDAALKFLPENSPALGFGFRVGFLGLLHMEIVQERLEREFDLDLIVTSPTVSYKLEMTDGEEQLISSASEVPDRSKYNEILEPWAKLEIVVPQDMIGSVMSLVSDRRGAYKNTNYIDDVRALVIFEIPMVALVSDFYDDLKSVSAGYASMSYEMLDYRPGGLAKIDILLAGDEIGPLSFICPRVDAHKIGSRVCEKLKEVIPRTNFVIAIQAAIGGKIVARESISAYRKDVTAKLYGGDYSRKKKLLENQKAGKKRMKQMGAVTIPQDAFMTLMKK